MQAAFARLSRRQIYTLVVAIALVALRRTWLLPIAAYLIATDPLLRPADALVPLAGDRERVAYAAHIYSNGSARWFAITDTSYREGKLAYAEAIRREALRLGIPAANIRLVPGQAHSTYQEALYLRQLAQGLGWRSIIIITSPYHTRRSRLIFADVFRNTGVTISIRSVEPSWYKPAAWWQTSQGRSVTWQEYVKLLLHFAGYSGPIGDVHSYQLARRGR